MVSREYSEDNERYSESEYHESDEDNESKESPEDKSIRDLEREEEIEKVADKASRELDEMESETEGAKDIADKSSRELDSLERAEEQSLEAELRTDLQETRDDLHDRFVNDVERQLDHPSNKDSDVEELEEEGNTSERTESNEPHYDTGDGMAYALETKNESSEATKTETEEEKQEDSEQEVRESTEPQAKSEDVGEPVHEKCTNRIIRHETEGDESTSSPETQKQNETKTSRTSLEMSETEENPSTPEVNEGLSNPESAASNEVQDEYYEPSTFDCVQNPSTEISETEENEDQQTIEQKAESEDLEQNLEDATEFAEDESNSVSREESEESVEHTDSEPEISKESEVKIEEARENDATEHDEMLPEDLEDFVKRVEDILDETMGADDDYDYVQDPLTGLMQRVPKILVEYETEEQRYRRKIRNLFAELTEEERDRFKEIVLKREKTEDRSFAEQVESLWTKVVEKTKQNRNRVIEPKATSDELPKTLAEVFRLSSAQNMSEREISRKMQMSRNQVRNALRDAIIHRRYFSEGQTFYQISNELNLTIYHLRMIFRKHEWKMRIQRERKRLSDSEIRKLHYEKRMTFFQISQYSGLDMPSIRKTIGVRKSRTRYEEIGRLYFQEGYSFKMISDILGVSMKTIRRAFKKNKWSFRKSTTTVHMDPEWIFHLYFIEGFSQCEIADMLGVHKATIEKFFNDQEWLSRGIKQRKQIDIDEKRRKYQKQRRKKLKETRVEIFGNTCYACQTENASKKNLHLHRKDGTEHDRNLFRSLKKLKSLRPIEWVPLCDRCHLGIHLLMTVYGYDWIKIEAFLKARSKESIKPKGVLDLPNDSTPLSKQAQKIGLNATKKQLKEALFGETCSLCSHNSEDNSLILHRKDGMTHKPEMIQRKKYLQKLDPDMWALVCHDCHNIAQWALDKLGIEWSKLSKILK
jgi:transposase